MSQFLNVLSVWLHLLATVIFIGYYLLLSVLCLPALQAAAPDKSEALVRAISRRSQVWLWGALAVFAITGLVLMLQDPRYLGLGNFGNAWSMLMLIKHTLVLVMLGTGLWAASVARSGQAADHFRQLVDWTAVCGALVLLLTAVAQGL